MKSQLPKPPTNAGGPIAWGYRTRPFERERVAGQHVEIEVAVYRVMLWGCLMYQRPANVYSMVLN